MIGVLDESIKILAELEKLKGDDAPLILYCLLNRIPIIISGKDPDWINEFISKLTALVPFRIETHYGSTFNTQDELMEYINEENQNYDVRKRTYLCFCSSTPFALKSINDFKSWIIGMDKLQKKKHNIKKFLELTLKGNTISTKLVGLDKGNLQEELIFEKTVLRSFLEPEVIQKMELYFNNFEKLLLKMLSEDFPTFLADIQEEKEAVKLHLYKTRIQNFVSAAKKIYLILSKIYYIDFYRTNKEIDVPKLSKETILGVVNFNDANIQRILSFIQEEYFGFVDYIEGLDHIEFSKYVDITLKGAKQDYMRRMGGF